MSTPADFLFVDGEVLTVDDDFTIAEAVAVRGNRILATGSTAGIRAFTGPRTTVVDLHGRTVLPGINDSHLHGVAWGLTRPPFSVDVGHPAVNSIAGIVARICAAARYRADGEWISGHGWDPGYLRECVNKPGLLPDRTDLDEAAPDHPVCLTDFSGHMIWVNSAALRMACIDADSVAPPGGVIDTDAAGQPTGILREAAQNLVQRHLPTATGKQRKAAIQAAVSDLHSLGITSYTEPGLGPGGRETFGGALDTASLDAYAELAAAGRLACRVSVLLLPAPMGGSAADLQAGLGRLADRAAGDPRRFAVIGVKIFADGVPPNRTAWMREEYSDGGHGALCVHGGTPALQEAELAEMVRVSHRAGYQVGVHVTGDRAIDSVVDAFVAADAEHPRPEARHYVIHGDFAGPASLAKLAAHRYGVNMNPAIKWTIADLMESVVGPERAAYQWPVRSAIDAGIEVCASSDAPITAPNWRQGVAAMMLRESRASGRTSGPEERVGLTEAIRAYTVNPARQDFAEKWKGTIEPGKVADLCVLGGNLRAADPHDLPELPVDLTMFDGELVYER